MSSAAGGSHWGPAREPPFKNAVGRLTFKVRGDQTNGKLTAFESEIAPGDGPPLHLHVNEDEAFYVIDGDVRFMLGDAMRSTPTGTFVFIPRGVAHCFQNGGDGPARILLVLTPSGMEEFFERFGLLLAPDPDDFRAIGSEDARGRRAARTVRARRFPRRS
jgi:quercetin dioxygenase-like cupin family protein